MSVPFKKRGHEVVYLGRSCTYYRHLRDLCMHVCTYAVLHVVESLFLHISEMYLGTCFEMWNNTWKKGGCYDHNFLRFSPILALFLKNQCHYPNFSKNKQYFEQKMPNFATKFLAKIFEKISVPGTYLPT
jgi:hypothetical protein